MDPAPTTWCLSGPPLICGHGGRVLKIHGMDEDRVHTRSLKEPLPSQGSTKTHHPTSIPWRHRAKEGTTTALDMAKREEPSSLAVKMQNQPRRPRHRAILGSYATLPACLTACSACPLLPQRMVLVLKSSATSR
ncbi:hypothetical protein LX36DRAFT_442910 [Colletotrichum falcatum]|nr:hypothetical protein LX36DRAFT_442910 [Colletotrichum falcatum]